MSADEYRRWIAYDIAEPIPDLNWLLAQVCQTIANANRGKGSKEFKIRDFMPRKVRSRRKPGEKQTTDEVKAIVRSLG
jgi:hypothetical protein